MRNIVIVLTMFAAFMMLACMPALAQGDRITLLTVTEGPAPSGGTADLYLEIRPGTGAIFIDSFPLTRLDTQGSTRYANQIACDFLQADCSRYDFFYTIRANSAIVGGPSAGAAMAVLTAAVLDGEKIDQDMAMTGTINSGGIIGPVAGIPQKVAGARAAGIGTVLVPSLAVGENGTGDAAALEELSDEQVTVVEVSTLEDALERFTGKQYRQDLPPLEVPQEYLARMKEVADEICSRTGVLRAQVPQYNDTNNFTTRIAAVDPEHHYSRASLCFSANIELATLALQNTSLRERRELHRDLRTQARALELATDQRQIGTISDLEVYAIVKERVLEAQSVLEQANLSSPAGLAYAQERLVSAHSWSGFFGIPGKEFQLDEEYLRRACLSKIAEADERVNYVRLYTPELVAESETTLAKATALSREEPILCIFTASQAKAQANLLASVLAVSEDNVHKLLDEKLRANALVLQKQQREGMFPILGYSYTDYARDLGGHSPYSALIFSEYSLELSNLDMYFPQENGVRLPAWFWQTVQVFALGAIFGAAVAALVLRGGVQGRQPSPKARSPRPQRPGASGRRP